MQGNWRKVGRCPSPPSSSVCVTVLAGWLSPEHWRFHMYRVFYPNLRFPGQPNQDVSCPDIPILPTHLRDHRCCETPPPTVSSSHGAACQGTVTELEGSPLQTWAASLQSSCVLSLVLGGGGHRKHVPPDGTPLSLCCHFALSRLREAQESRLRRLLSGLTCLAPSP